MENSKQTQRIIQVVNEDFSIRNWMEGFILDCKAKNLAGGTIKFYQVKLQKFLEFCDLRMISEIQEITSQFLREYIHWLESTGHSPGGCHAFYRTVKAFLKWYERENDLDNWKNPICKVQGPKIKLEPLEPAKIEIIKAMLLVCGNDFYGVRDKLILLILMDTGMRANELINLIIESIDVIIAYIDVIYNKNMNSVNELVAFIKNELEKRNWTNADLARNCGISQAQISRILNKGYQPGLDFFNSVADVFNYPKEIVFRLAGILPNESEKDIYQKRILNLLEQLDENEKHLVFDFIQMLTNRRNFD
jgi:integrase